MSEPVIDKITFESPDIKGYRISAWYLLHPKSDCLVRVTKGEEIVREFLYPAYKVWNLAAHAEEIIDSEIEKNQQGYLCAGSDGLGGMVTPRDVKE